MIQIVRKRKLIKVVDRPLKAYEASLISSYTSEQRTDKGIDVHRAEVETDPENVYGESRPDECTGKVR